MHETTSRRVKVGRATYTRGFVVLAYLFEWQNVCAVCYMCVCVYYAHKNSCIISVGEKNKVRRWFRVHGVYVPVRMGGWVQLNNENDLQKLTRNAHRHTFSQTTGGNVTK